jgi:hypothetical protein
VIDVHLLEVLRPVLAQLVSQVVRLVDQQHELLLAPVLVHVLDVLLQVRRIVEVRVPRIHDLQEHVRFLNNTPELTPHVEVLLEGRDSQCHIVLFYSRDIPSPLKESHVFLGLDLLR